MDKVHISAFPDHLISHEDMPGQHTKRGGPQDLKYNTQLFMYFIGVNLKVTAKGTLPKDTGDLSTADGTGGVPRFQRYYSVLLPAPSQLYCETYEADGASIPQLSPSLDTLSRWSAWKRTLPHHTCLRKSEGSASTTRMHPYPGTRPSQLPDDSLLDSDISSDAEAIAALGLLSVCGIFIL